MSQTQQYDSGSKAAKNSPENSTTSSKSLSSDLSIEDMSTSSSSASQNKPSSRNQHPQGWSCDYNSLTDEYKFELKSHQKSADETRDETLPIKTPTIDHDVQTSRRPTLNLYECKYGYHFPTSPTPSMISNLAKQVQKAPNQPGKQVSYGKLNSANEDEQQAKRLKDMFPTATEAVVEQMIKIYNGREGLIKAALISLGYKRAKEYGGQKEPAQSPIMLMMAKPSSKKLFDKLVGYFPGADEALIKNLMFAHKEVEYEIISKLVESNKTETDGTGKYHRANSDGDYMESKRLQVNGAIMKLRYLKFLYPTCEELELYHLLNCNDLNTQKVMEVVEKKGHKRANIEEVLQARKSLMQKIRAQQANRLRKEKTSERNLLEVHQNRVKPSVDAARANALKSQLKSKFEQLDDELVMKALVAADYNESLAARFLEEMEPIDETAYKQRYQVQRELEPDVVRFPCKGVQKDLNDFMSVTSNESVCIPRAIVDCQTAVALLKLDASTFTQEDFQQPKFTHREGPKVHLATGSIYSKLEVKLSSRRGHDKELDNRSQYLQICAQPGRAKPRSSASGRNQQLRAGRNRELRYGHNPGLIKRLHPFFKDVRA